MMRTRPWPFVAVVLAALAFVLAPARAQEAPPLKLAIAGLVHGHVSGFLRNALARPDVQIVGVYRSGSGAAAAVRRAAEARRRRHLHRPRRDARSDEARGRRVVHQHLRSSRPSSRPRRRSGIHVMMEKPLAVSNADAQRIRARRQGRQHPGAGELRDDVVSEPRRDLGDGQGAAGGRGNPQDGGDGRPQRPEGDQRPAGVPRLAVRSGQERRRRALRLRLLRREPHDVADGQRASGRRDRDDAAVPARGLSARRRRSDDPAGVPGGAGHHPGVVELAVQPQGSRGLRRARPRHRHRRRTGCASRCRRSPNTR